ncbi:unnamed protein product [Cuscuta epithymum]|uniref:Uncharacterized protein n=1 Tax=Cuscuta epithymum TaxID=186058 RepID=A0AAV0DDV8_9ASTE|nr:unnamed protein product [Cuscuta epithymum]
MRWSESFGFTVVEVDCIYMGAAGSSWGGARLGLHFIPAQVNQAAKEVAKLGSNGPFSWRIGDFLPKTLAGSIHLDSIDTPYIIC